MAQLRRDFAAFQAQDSVILVIGAEGAPAFRRYWQEHDLPFIGLPDPQHRVLKRYGQQIKLFKYGRMPAMVIVDRQGTARFVHYGHSMSDIPQNDAVLATLSDLQAEARSPSQSAAD